MADERGRQRAKLDLSRLIEAEVAGWQLGSLVGDAHVELDHLLQHIGRFKFRRSLGDFFVLVVRRRGVAVAVVLVDERLEVPHLDELATVLLTLYHRVHLDWVLLVLSQQILDHRVVKELVLSETENLESLLLRDEAAFNPQTLVSHLTSALVAELLHS